MAYTLSGEFFEVCDCEVVCSCWAGVDPGMGSCTGLFTWFIEAGTVDGQDVTGCKAMLLFNGTSCDNARHLLLLVDGKTPAKQNAVRNAMTAAPGPWWDVVRLAQGVVMPPLVPAAIKASPANRTGKKVSLSAKATDIVAEAHCDIDGYELRGPAGSLVTRSTGAAVPQAIQCGKVFTDAASGTGMNLLATNSEPSPYTFDVDITDVSAVRGKFNYTLP
jgi:hypothetical protein